MLTAILCVLLSAAAVPAAGAPPAAAAPVAGFWESIGTATPEQAAARLAASMSDEELLGQTLCFGYLGTSPSAEIRGWIRDRGIGGVKIFARNVDDLASLGRDVAAMQRLSQSTRLAPS